MANGELIWNASVQGAGNLDACESGNGDLVVAYVRSESTGYVQRFDRDGAAVSEGVFEDCGYSFWFTLVADPFGGVVGGCADIKWQETANLRFWKFDREGNLLWAVPVAIPDDLNGYGYVWAELHGVAIDSNGDTYFTGLSYKADKKRSDAPLDESVILRSGPYYYNSVGKIRSDGTVAWVRHLGNDKADEWTVPDPTAGEVAFYWSTDGGLALADRWSFPPYNELDDDDDDDDTSPTADDDDDDDDDSGCGC